ncbi:shikimate kinase [Virgibacillus kekensis]|uniref:Shikimate kinase n=1 Tax=Virgibacillus kekensis TaxID=202261 RepID=A0ABV9DJN8_9BACI
MKNLFLTGFMGSGKTSVGAALSELTEVPVLDTDQMIEEKYDESIKEIFRKYGESTFRKYETEILADFPHKDCVISTGGGIVGKRDNIDSMKKSGYIIYLQTSFEEIARRLKNDTSRPLWNNNNGETKTLFDKRIKLYEEYADISIQTDYKSAREIAIEILAELDKQSLRE